MNRYFTPNIDNINLEEILGLCIETKLDPIRLDGIMGICKLPIDYGDDTPSCLVGVPEYNYKDILILRRTKEWFNQDELN